MIFFLKKKKCVIFVEKREKENKSRKNKLKIWKTTKEKFDYFQKKRKTESGTTEKSRRAHQSVWSRYLISI